MWSAPLARLDARLGGPRQRSVIVALAAVLALDSADKASIGANAVQLQAALHIGKPQIGIILAASSLIGSVGGIPAGTLVDRMRRTALLKWAVALWAGAMVLSGLASSFAFLLGAQLLLGLLTAVAGPAIASILGDVFDEQSRGRAYGYILAGELVGAGFGFVVAGQVAVLSWRAPFFLLVPPTLGVWWIVDRLSEPPRGGAGERLSLPGSAAPSLQSAAPAPATAPTSGPAATAAARLPLPAAIRYVLHVRTNVVIIVASALGYFFFSGVRGFAVEFARHQYGVGQSVASALTLVLGIGALLGVLAGGWLADWPVRRNWRAGRVVLPGIGALLAGILFVPALLTRNLALAIVLLSLAAVCLGSVNPPLDAARLDIMPPQLWGRAEGIRGLLRSLADGAAPFLFGVLSANVFGGDTGLRNTFLISLVTLFAAAAIMLTFGRRTYPRDARDVPEPPGLRGGSATPLEAPHQHASGHDSRQPAHRYR